MIPLQLISLPPDSNDPNLLYTQKCIPAKYIRLYIWKKANANVIILCPSEHIVVVLIIQHTNAIKNAVYIVTLKKKEKLKRELLPTPETTMQRQPRTTDDQFK